MQSWSIETWFHAGSHFYFEITASIINLLLSFCAELKSQHFFFCWWIGRQLWFYAALVEKYATAMHNFTNYFKFVFTVVIDAAAADVVATAVINISYKFGHGFPWLDSTLLLLTSFFFALLFSSFENWADQNNKTTNRVYSATYPGIKTRLIRWCASETNAKLKKIKEAKLEAEN